MLSKIRRKLQKAATSITQIPAEIQYRLESAQHASKLPSLDTADRSIVEACQNTGVYVTSLAELGFESSASMLEAAHSYLDQMYRLRPPQSLPEGDEPIKPLHPQIFTMTDRPEFTTWGQESRLLNIVENYIGLPVGFQGVHLRRDFANPAPITTELWHQDIEDRRMLKAIIYLTDVNDEQDGPFEYIPKSAVSPLVAQLIHRQIDRAPALGIPDQIMEKFVPRSAWKRCLGAAGTVVFMDPKNIFHHGKSRWRERAALFYIYTSAKPMRPEHCTQYRDQTFARPELVH